MENVTYKGIKSSEPTLSIESTPDTPSGTLAHGGNIVFHYNRLCPELYDTIGYFYWYIRNTNGNLFADAGEFKLMNISNTAGQEKARFIIAAVWLGVLQTLASWDWENGLQMCTPLKLKNAANALGSVVLPTGAGKTVDDVISALQSLGLVKQA